MRIQLTLLIVLIVTSTMYPQNKDLIPVKPIRTYHIKIDTVKGKYYHQYKKSKNVPLDGKYEITIMVVDKNAGDIEVIENGLKKRTLKYDLPNSGYRHTEIEEEGKFHKGYKNGLWKTIYKNKLVKTENWNHGLIMGKYQVYDTTGTLLYQTNFGATGNGTYKEYDYKTGILKQEGNYQNGTKEGVWCTYDEQGKRIKTTKYKAGDVTNE